MDLKLIAPIFFITIIPGLILGQLYYPDDDGNVQEISPISASSPLQPVNLTQLTELRGTSQYNDYVDKIISTGILKLTLAVQSAAAKNYLDNNIVYAPVSIAAALALVLLGSNGKTFEEISTLMGLATGVDIHNRSQFVHEQFGRMLQKLQVTSGFDIGKQVNFATAIFVQNGYPIRKVYKETAEKIYQSEVLNVDFSGDPENAQQSINAWVSERTNGKITQLLEETPSSATKVILASAMYFKAEWEKPFFDGTTKRRPFFVNGRKSKSEFLVEMMSNGGVFPYYKDASLGCEVIGFPYKGNQTTMYVVLPNESNKEKLKQLESQLSYEEILRFVDNVKYTGAVILFPKMRIESTVDLRSTLQAMGLKSLFNPAQANLAILSPGTKPIQQNIGDRNSEVTKTGSAAEEVPISPNNGFGNDVLIFTRNREIVNCTQVFDNSSDVNTCENVETGTKKPTPIVVKGRSRRPQVGRRVIGHLTDTIDNIREQLNAQPDPEKAQNPGLYADNVIHKVFMDITESGTEAAASTSVSLSRDGGRITFRVDVPFFFFIMHEQTKTLLFWGSVTTPSPSF